MWDSGSSWSSTARAHLVRHAPQPSTRRMCLACQLLVVTHWAPNWYWVFCVPLERYQHNCQLERSGTGCQHIQTRLASKQLQCLCQGAAAWGPRGARKPDQLRRFSKGLASDPGQILLCMRGLPHNFKQNCSRANLPLAHEPATNVTDAPTPHTQASQSKIVLPPIFTLTVVNLRPCAQRTPLVDGRGT